MANTSLLLKYSSSRRLMQIAGALLRSARAASTQPLTVRTEENGIRTITLNNPGKRNALSLAMLQSIKADLVHEIDNPALRVIVLSAAGPVFSSGHDLKELSSHDASYQADVFDACSDMMNIVQDIPVPVLAQVNGLATAAGCQLVASCDIAIASDTSSFATPGVSVGLFCSTPGVALARSVPKKVALSMLLTGHPISAQEALLHGLVSKVVPADQLQAETLKIARRICETSRPVVALGKRFFYQQILMNRNTAYGEASRMMVKNLRMADGREGLEAFVSKRQPIWTHSEH